MNQTANLTLAFSFLLLFVLFLILALVFGAYITDASTNCPNVNSKNAKTWKNVCIACTVIFGILAFAGLFIKQYHIFKGPTLLTVGGGSSSDV